QRGAQRLRRDQGRLRGRCGCHGARDRRARRAVAAALRRLRHRDEPDERRGGGQVIRAPRRRYPPAGAVDVVVIGAGHAGLAMSRCLAELSIDHVVLERGEIANSWRRERWDSLRLLTPNWQSRLPGYAYRGPDPDGYMSVSDVVEFIDGYARLIGAPVKPHTTVTSVVADGCGYRVATDRGAWRCRAVVLASGAHGVPAVPAAAAALPRSVTT